jgi:pimeloyl-ACP methyl ester carboxylesterase
MAKFKRGYADGPFGLVHYQDTGGDGAPLVLCHQSPQSLRQFDTVLPELLARGVRAIAIDTPGFGMSDVPDFTPRIEDYARAVPPVLDHLRIEKAHFVGHHTGAQIVTEVALQFPDRVLTLVLNGPNPLSSAEREDALAHVEAAEKNYVYDADGSHLMRNFALRWNFYGPGGDARLTTRVIAEKFIGLGPFWYGHHAAHHYDHAASLMKIKHRTLILTNTGDIIYPAAQTARNLRPDFAYAELEGGTIDIVDQQPAAWAVAVVTFTRGG